MKWERHGERQNGEPLHLRIYQDLLKLIEEGEFEPGDRLPPETELQRRYGVSRTPVRQALGRLESEALLVRQPGKGTFVRHPHDVGAWGALSGFGRYYRDQWDQLTTRTLAVEEVKPSAAVRGLMDLDAGDCVIRIRRTRSIANSPVVYLDHFLPTNRFDIETFAAAGHFFSMRVLLREAFSVEIRSATEELEAVAAPASIAAQLGIAPNSPVLHIQRVSFDWRRKPVQVICYYVRTDLWRYRIHLQV